jgi:hypothetical protein
VNYTKIVDFKNNIVYRIERTTSEPYIIYKNKLYIPDRYNILGREDAKETVYSEYELK